MNNILGVDKPIKIQKHSTIIFKNGVFLLFFIFVAYFSTGSSISCYECNSNWDIRCALPYPPTEYVINCDEMSAKTNLTYQYCRKISQVIQDGINSCKILMMLRPDR